MTKDIRVFPRPTGNPEIQYSGSAHSSIKFEVLESGSISFSGASGSLFSISDSLIGSLFSVNDISGLPVIEAFSDDRVVMGSFGQNTLVVTGSLVGIGTDVPANNLHLYSTSTTGLTIESTTADPQIHLISTTDDWYVYADQSQAANFVIQSEGNPRFVIETGGDIGIGVTNPNARLEIEDGGTAQTQLLKITQDDANPYGLVIGNDTFSTIDYEGFGVVVGNTGLSTIDSRGTGAALAIRVGATPTEAVRILTGGNVGIGTNNPGTKLDVRDDSTGTTTFAQFGSTTISSSTREGGIKILASAGSVDHTVGI